MPRWFYTPLETLSIQTTTHVFTLTGKGMEKIEQSLLREKVKELREFTLATIRNWTRGSL
jgi:hypothetical protein